MYQESFDEKHKQGLEHLTGGKKWLYYCNERKDGEMWVYDVFEFEGRPTDNEIKVALIGNQYTLEDEVKLLRKVVASLLRSIGLLDETVTAFTDYNNDVTDIINSVNTVGKVVQTLEGNGTMANPFKNWELGMSVEEGKWYFVPDPNDPKNPYLWEAIKSGVPAWEKDADFFDVV